MNLEDKNNRQPSGYRLNTAPTWPALIRRGLAGDAAAGALGHLQFQRWRRVNAHWLRRAKP